MRFRILLVSLMPLFCQAQPPPIPESIKLYEAIVRATHSPDSITLYSITREEETHLRKDSFGFHRFKILSQRTITDPGKYPELLTALKNGFSPVNFEINCGFSPHHGLRLSKGKRNLDLLIGFNCALVLGYDSGQRLGPFYIPRSAEPELNKVLASLGLPILNPDF